MKFWTFFVLFLAIFGMIHAQYSDTEENSYSNEYSAPKRVKSGRNGVDPEISEESSSDYL